MAETLADLISTTSAQDVLVQSLRDAGFEGDLSKGSPIYQLLIDPSAVIYSLQVANQDALRESWSLLSRGETDTSEVDTDALTNLFNNLRVSPTPGSKATGNIQLVFDSNEVRSISGVTFIDSNGSTFVPTLQYVFVPSESYRTQYSESELVYASVGSGYAVDIEVECTEVGETFVASGDTFTTSMPGLTSATASMSFTGGRATDTLEDLVREIPMILSETSMASPISVTASLYNEFPEIKEMSIFRAGDAELRRANKNILGVDSGAADIVTVTSSRPGVKRSLVPGHVELSCTEGGEIYNSEHLLGFAYRQATAPDAEDMILLDDIINGFIFVEGNLTSRDAVGISAILEAGLETDDTQPTSLLTPDSEPQDGTSIVVRSFVTDSRYGNLPVTGSDPNDFYFSSYQHRVKFEFRTDWEDIREFYEEASSKVSAWVNFWRVTYQAIAHPSVDYSAILLSFAESYGTTIDDVPRLLRIEVPVYADSVGYPKLADIQEYLSEDSRRCFGQDYVVKTPHINSVALNITVSRDLNFLRFREDHFKAKIAEYISSKGLSHSGVITTEHIKELIFEEGPINANNLFELNATVRRMSHDEVWISESTDHINYAVDDLYGITERNSILSCSADQVGIVYQ